MNLRVRASADFEQIVTNTKHFGWGITVTDPAGTSAPLVGFTSDISQVIDPETGQAVSGRLASVCLSIGALTDAGIGIPVGVSDDASKPWVMVFDDPEGNTYTFKVKESNPDRGIGSVICVLEVYVP